MAFNWGLVDIPVSTGKKVRKIHLTNSALTVSLREAVETLRDLTRPGQPVTWAEPSIVPGSTKIKASHINEIRAYVEAFWRPGKVWSQQEGITQANGRLTQAIKVRVPHINELAAVLDEIHDEATGFYFTSAVLSASEGGSPTPLKHVKIEVGFTAYNDILYPNPEFVFTVHNTSGTPLPASFSAFPVLSPGATSFIYELIVPENLFQGLGTGYYTVSLGNYPSISPMNTNSVTVISALLATDIYTDKSTYDIGENVVITASYNRVPEAGDTITLTSNQGVSSMFSAIRASPSGIVLFPQIGVQFNGALTILPVAYEVATETLSLSPNDGSAEVTIGVVADLRLVEVKSYDHHSGLDTDIDIEYDHDVRSDLIFNRNKRAGDSGLVTLTGSDGQTFFTDVGILPNGTPGIPLVVSYHYTLNNRPEVDLEGAEVIAEDNVGGGDFLEVGHDVLKTTTYFNRYVVEGELYKIDSGGGSYGPSLNPTDGTRMDIQTINVGSLRSVGTGFDTKDVHAKVDGGSIIGSDTYDLQQTSGPSFVEGSWVKYVGPGDPLSVLDKNTNFVSGYNISNPPYNSQVSAVVNLTPLDTTKVGSYFTVGTMLTKAQDSHHASFYNGPTLIGLSDVAVPKTLLDNMGTNPAAIPPFGSNCVSLALYQTLTHISCYDRGTLIRATDSAYGFVPGPYEWNSIKLIVTAPSVFRLDVTLTYWDTLSSQYLTHTESYPDVFNGLVLPGVVYPVFGATDDGVSNSYDIPVIKWVESQL